MFKKGFLFFICSIMLSILPIVSISAPVSKWQIIPSESELTFTATQNGAPVTGKFTRFNGEIQFDPEQLEQSQVKIIVDTGSVSASYGELVETLKTPDWFNVQAFPQAIFTADKFKKLNDKNFVADGSLSIRDQKKPLTVHFTVLSVTTDTARIKGDATIRRNDFGVGQGEWASTEEVKNEVKINFVITAKKMVTSS